MEQEKRLPKICPSCGMGLRVHSLHCRDCGTKIEGDYVLPALAKLSEEEQQFICDFVESSGSLKEMAQKLSLSYPTVRNRLDDIILRLKSLQL